MDCWAMRRQYRRLKQKKNYRILLEGENVNAAFKLVRDIIVFTDKRLILVDKQGLTGKKTEIQSIPYKSISRFSVETATALTLIQS